MPKRDRGDTDPGGPSAFPGFATMEPTGGEPAAVIDQLAARRRARGLSQTEVAARMGTSQSALARLESGQADVRMSTLTRYAAALDAEIGFGLRDQAQLGDQAQLADHAHQTEE